MFHYITINLSFRFPLRSLHENFPLLTTIQNRRKRRKTWGKTEKIYLSVYSWVVCGNKIECASCSEVTHLLSLDGGVIFSVSSDGAARALRAFRTYQHQDEYPPPISTGGSSGCLAFVVCGRKRVLGCSLECRWPDLYLVYRHSCACGFLTNNHEEKVKYVMILFAYMYVIYLLDSANPQKPLWFLARKNGCLVPYFIQNGMLSAVLCVVVSHSSHSHTSFMSMNASFH